MTERKYALTRLRRGDYLLPSNDQRVLWRLVAYEEDGGLEVDNGRGGWREIRGTFWAAYRRPMPAPDEMFDLGFENWEHWAGPFKTREAAIHETMTTESERRTA